jgi:hypothetical protein
MCWAVERVPLQVKHIFMCIICIYGDGELTKCSAANSDDLAPVLPHQPHSLQVFVFILQKR